MRRRVKVLAPLLAAVRTGDDRGHGAGGRLHRLRVQRGRAQWDNRVVGADRGRSAASRPTRTARRGANIGLNQDRGRPHAPTATHAALRVPRPGRHRHRRLPADQADHLPQPDAGRHAPLLRDHRARRAPRSRAPATTRGARATALNAQGRWYGYPEGNADTGIVTVSKRRFPALAGYGGGSRSLTVRIGCTERRLAVRLRRGRRTSATTCAAREVDVNDPTAPRDLTVDASGPAARRRTSPAPTSCA